MTRVWRGLLLALVVLAMVFSSTAAQEEGFQERFDNTGLDGWEHSPEVVVTDGVLRISPGNFAMRMGDWGQVTFSLKMRFDSPGETIIMYHFRDDTHYVLIFMQEGIVLEKVQAGAPERLGESAGFDLYLKTWINIEIRMADGQHLLLINDETIITAADAEFLPAGAIMLQSHGERTTEFDDLVLNGQADTGSEPDRFPPESAPVEEAPVLAPQVPDQNDSGNALGQLGDLLGGDGTVSALDVAINLALSALAAFILGRLYIHWGFSLSNRRRFAANFMLVTLTTTFIILVVRSSVALSLGLVGALSIVRFRTAIKEPEELAYLFAAIGIGVGLGDNQRLLTLLALALMIVVIALMRLFRQSQSDVNLHLGITSYPPEKVELNQIVPVLEKYCSKLRLLRYDENQDTLEISFVIEFRRTVDLAQLRAALLELSNELEISFLDNKGVW